jgi:hypothetical protein
MKPMRFGEFMQILTKFQEDKIIADDSFVRIDSKALYEISIGVDGGTMPKHELNLRSLYG